MKRTYVKLMLRDMKGTVSRFLSIMGIVALGVGFLTGLTATTPDMQFSMQTWYREHALHDVNIKSTLGITEEDVRLLGEQSYIKYAVGGYMTDVMLEDESGNVYTARVYGLPLERNGEQGFVNRMDLLEGAMPARDSECVVGEAAGFSQADFIGAHLKLSSENKDLDELYDMYSFGYLDIVGTVQSPLYYSVESEPTNVGSGEVDMVLYAPLGFYDLDVYTDIFAVVEGADAYEIFSDEYKDCITSLTDGALGEFADVRSKARYDELIDDANAELADAEREFEEGRQEAEDELEKARRDLVSAQNEADEAEDYLINTTANLLTGAEIKLYSTLQSRASAVIGEYMPRIDDAHDMGAIDDASYEAIKRAADGFSSSSTADVKAAVRTLANWLNTGGRAQVDELRAQLVRAGESGLIDPDEYQEALAAADGILAAVDEVTSAQAEIDRGWAQYVDGLRQVESARQRIAAGWGDWYEARDEAERELADAESKIEDARREIAKIERAEWLLFTLEDNMSFTSFLGNSEKVANIAKVFPVFFFLVAALVALTTMTRMVEEQRTQIGTLKALGYSDGSLIFYYLVYSALASLVGSIVGAAIGLVALPAVIYNAYSMMYNLPPLLAQPWWGSLAVIIPVAVAGTCLATAFACFAQLREKPSSLMMQKAPVAGKRVLLERVSFVWKRLSFTHKVTVRNLFRYKKRLFMTVIGVAGCCALLLTGFGIRDSISDIVGLQFNEIYNYNANVMLKDDISAVADGALKQTLGNPGEVLSYVETHAETGYLRANGGSKSINIYVPGSTEQLAQLINFRTRLGHEPIEFDDNTLILTEKICEQLGVEAGDTVELVNGDNISAEFTVGGVCEYYVYNYAYMSAGMYEEAFGSEPDYTVLLVDFADDSKEARDAAAEKLLGDEGVSYVSFLSTIGESFTNMLSSIDYIVIVIIICAGMLAGIVLYNLTNINVCERKKELATLKVLGFHERETAMYIYRETLLLTLMGAAVGLLIGVWLHAFVIKTVEVDVVMFGRSIYPLSFVYAAALTIVFSLIVDAVMLKKLRDIDMVESMKANE